MKKKQILTFLLIVVISILIIVFGNRKNTFIEKGIKDIYSYIVKYASIPFEYVSKKFDELTIKSDIYSENQKLKQELNEIEKLKSENNQLKNDIKNMKSLLNLKSTLSEYEKINATVINRNIGYWYETFTIDKGEINGIKIGQAVVTNDGLIGYIDSTNYKTSDVKLITSNSNKITVKIEDDEYVYGILSKYENDYLIVNNVESKVSVGSSVVTAGLGTNFPEGIYIGKVEKVESDNFDLINTVKVKNNTNYNLISNVSVLEKK